MTPITTTCFCCGKRFTATKPAQLYCNKKVCKEYERTQERTFDYEFKAEMKRRKAEGKDTFGWNG